MGRRNGLMSDAFKDELARELGFYDVVQREGWGGIRAKDAGNMVKLAVEMAQRQMQK
ncbi:small, acid-soluble spore protein, alpha/beta type [Peribacillus sp. SCS-37]|uniref:small, acid-soluble spore protein, alpha/beta type n=1 Tax=Paraperibacillus esterisolvens TaxID=3115296 RepID=UPI00390586BF